VKVEVKGLRRGFVTALLAIACAAPVAAAQDSASTQAQGDLPPAGFGTLNQDDIAITLRQEDLEARIVPLDERVLRLLAPDAYASLRGILQTRAAQLDSVSRRNGVAVPGILFVTFFARRNGARFDPQNLSVVIRNQLYRPIGVVPYSSNFNSQQLDVRQQASGLLLFEATLPVFEPFSVSYGTASSDWEGKLTRIQRERGRVMGRTVRRDSGGN
jgi:hypothetical protein